MSEPLPETAHAGDDVAAPDEPAETTGHPVVDEVLASLSDLGERPVSEHVVAFERAHDRLRGALADAGSGPA